MALAASHTWNPGDILKSVDLNGAFTNILTQPIALISPTTGAIDFNLQAHVNLLPSVISATSGTAGNVLTIQGGLATWQSGGSGGGASFAQIFAAGQVFGG